MNSFTLRGLFAGAVLLLLGATGCDCHGAAQAVAQTPVPFPFDPGHATDDANNKLPQLVRSTPIAYPADAIARGLVDRVFVAFVVDKSGKPQRVRAFFGQHPLLEQAAVEAVERWAFSPGVHGGRSVNTQMTVEIRFELEPAT